MTLCAERVSSDGTVVASRFAPLARFGIRVISSPTIEPVTVEEVENHLRLERYGPDRDWVVMMIPAAREWCEGWTGRALAPATFELAASAWPLRLELPMSPISAVTSVIYTDGDGIPTLLDTSDYILDNFADPARLDTAYGLTWPTLQAVTNGIRIRYVAGYSRPGPVDEGSPTVDTPPLPASIRAAILLVLGHLYENREDTTELSLQQLPLGAKALLEPYRLRLAMA